MKICSKCKLEKEIKEFYRDKNRKDGHVYWCKECLKPLQQNERGRQAKYRWAKKNSIKVSAYQKVLNALKCGSLIRQPCEKCKSEETQAHHDDYQKPLTVRWLCTQHHAEWHRNNKIIT